MLLAIFLVFAISWSVARSQATNTTAAPQPQSTACGDVIVAAQQGYNVFYAAQVFECLREVPFNEAVATRFLRYYNETLQFQSTLAFLRSPPKGYQQPAVDVQLQLQSIQANITAGVYTNQYMFEADVQLLISQMHDAHVTLSTGVSAPFSFMSQYGLVSASVDGKKAPDVFLQLDVLKYRMEGRKPSPITHINDVPVRDWLEDFAERESWGYVEKHADWNALMESPARDIQGSPSALRAASFYHGDELNFTFQDRTPIHTFWLASYLESNPTGPLTTAGDFYNFFVLGLYPAGYDQNNFTRWWPSIPTSDNDNTPNDPAPVPLNYGCTALGTDDNNWCLASFGAYPQDPAIAQDGLAITTAGIVTGYFLENNSVGILSLPSFDQYYEDIDTYFRAIDQFIGNATAQNTKRIIIDLQQNDGGLTMLALSVFKRFFYAIDPPEFSRIRSNEIANALGAAYSEWWSSLEVTNGGAAGINHAIYHAFANSEWVATNRINPATSINFTTWKEYYGPVIHNNGSFSLPQRTNFSDQAYSSGGFQSYLPYGYDGETRPGAPSQAFASDNILILTDGLCSSACAYFVDLMVRLGGARTLAVGGLPRAGPMQTASGNRGARVYTADDIDFDIGTGLDFIGNDVARSLLPSRDDTGMSINFASVNIRDRVRGDDGYSVPLQFRYEAADCRIYYTLANVYNATQLWLDAAAATWSDSGLCVEDSTGYPSSRNTTANHAPPTPPSSTPQLDLTKLAFENVANRTIFDIDIQDTTTVHSVKQTKKCNTQADCGNFGYCETVDHAQCTGTHYGGTAKAFKACLSPCNRDTCGTNCKNTKKVVFDTKFNTAVAYSGRSPVTDLGRTHTGLCHPSQVNELALSLECS